MTSASSKDSSLPAKKLWTVGRAATQPAQNLSRPPPLSARVSSRELPQNIGHRSRTQSSGQQLQWTSLTRPCKCISHLQGHRRDPGKKPGRQFRIGPTFPTWLWSAFCVVSTLPVGSECPSCVVIGDRCSSLLISGELLVCVPRPRIFSLRASWGRTFVT